MTPIASHITAFLRERLPQQRRASHHTCESYAYTLYEGRGTGKRGRRPGQVYRLRLNTKALSPAVSTFGGLVLATTVSEQTCDDAEIVRAYRDQTTMVEPGFRWIKNPAAISPVWLEKPQRIAALAMLTVVGLLVCSSTRRYRAIKAKRRCPQLRLCWHRLLKSPWCLSSWMGQMCTRFMAGRDTIG